MIKQAGFYRELDGHGEGTNPAPSLRDAARRTGEWDEDRILGYMESSTEIFSAMGAERDVITDDVWITGAGSLITDGTWMWPVELVHYVRRHHVALPDESEPVNVIKAGSSFYRCAGIVWSSCRRSAGLLI
ncbi:hypothetical protein ABZT43_40430, partial [Streptomyces sp. NPDC005349]